MMIAHLKVFHLLTLIILVKMAISPKKTFGILERTNIFIKRNNKYNEDWHAKYLYINKIIQGPF